MKTNQPKQEVKTHYEVTFGPKKEKAREMKPFNNEKEALDFFEMKDKEGMHVDAYEIETVVIVTKKKLFR